MTRTLNIYENPVIGVFATCTEDFALVPPGTNDKTSGILEKILDVEVVSTLVNIIASKDDVIPRLKAITKDLKEGCR